MFRKAIFFGITLAIVVVVVAFGLTGVPLKLASTAPTVVRPDAACVFRASNRYLYCDVRQDGGGGEVVRFLSFAQSTDKPLMGDIDGDGADNRCVYRSSAAMFYCETLNAFTDLLAVNFGFPNSDLPLMGDVNGDGRDDVCVFRPSNSRWFCDTGHDGGAAEFSDWFGFGTDIPIMGDVDGNGSDDPCVFRPSNSTWYCDTAHNGGAAEFSIVFANGSDVPVMGHPTHPLVPADSSVEVTRVSKIFGSRRSSWDDNVMVQNDNFRGVYGTDLGSVAFYQGQFYFNLGDTDTRHTTKPQPCDNLPNLTTNPVIDVPYIRTGRFLLAHTTDITPADGLDMGGYYCQRAPDGSSYSLKVNETPSGAIPNGMFTIQNNGSEYLFAHYMMPFDYPGLSGNDHQIYNSGVAKYNDSLKSFEPYKAQIYKWEGAWRSFGMNATWVDYDNGYLYIIGTPSGRFGGVQLARIRLEYFLAPDDTTHYFQYKVNGVWTELKTIPSNADRIKNSPWLIPPKFGQYRAVLNVTSTLDLDSYFDYDGYGVYGCDFLTVGEFSVVYFPHLSKFVLITGRYCAARDGGGVFYYVSDNIEGPWSTEKKLLNNYFDSREWPIYGTYTTDRLLDGNTMYFTGTTWGNLEDGVPTPYGVYLYKAIFNP